MKENKNWTSTKIPSQKNRSTIITKTGGLGYETALMLASSREEIILSDRNVRI